MATVQELCEQLEGEPLVLALLKADFEEAPAEPAEGGFADPPIPGPNDIAWVAAAIDEGKLTVRQAAAFYDAV